MHPISSSLMPLWILQLWVLSTLPFSLWGQSTRMRLLFLRVCIGWKANAKHSVILSALQVSGGACWCWSPQRYTFSLLPLCFNHMLHGSEIWFPLQVRSKPLGQSWSRYQRGVAGCPTLYLWRVLLEGPFDRVWYLEERVVSHYLPRELALKIIPLPLPESIRSTSTLHKKVLMDALQRHPALEFWKAGDYDAYRAT